MDPQEGLNDRRVELPGFLAAYFRHGLFYRPSLLMWALRCVKQILFGFVEATKVCSPWHVAYGSDAWYPKLCWQCDHLSILSSQVILGFYA
jgi:hypothetical protein